MPARSWDPVIVGALRTVALVYMAGRRGISVASLCTLREVSRSTVYRDLGAAIRAGWALGTRRENGRTRYYVERSVAKKWRAPPGVPRGNLITHAGVTDTQRGWARRLKITDAGMSKRISRHPDSPEEWFK